MFPVLTPAQLARIEAFGTHVTLTVGQVLVEPGQRFGGSLIVLSGSVDILKPDMTGEELVTTHRRGQFTGEISSLRGAAALVRIRVREAGEAISLDHDGLLRLVQGDAELSEIFMRAFILRRMGLLAMRQNEVVLIGSRHSADTLRLQQFLGRNGLPYHNVDVETDADVAELLERFHIGVADVPVVVCRGEVVMRNPSNAEIAECLGMNAERDASAVHDVIVIGAGPSGLAAAVYAASEGLKVLVLEASAPGGQAGSSSKIENYLGFPTGISGQALAGRAMVQAQKFGADIAIAGSAVRLNCEQRPYTVELSTGGTVQARTIVIATGAAYRSPALENLERFVGAGIYYAATHIEAQLCRDEAVVIVGGGNSAGQAAVFLAGGCRQVEVVVRGPGLAESMSRYLIHRIEESANINLQPHTELVALDGDERLRRVTWRCKTTQETVTEDINHVFLMTGAAPNTGWLRECVALDDKGFVRTGPDLKPADLTAAAWPLQRPPFALETNLPGVFAVGDVRSGSMKRVAAAVGEGSACIQAVHRALLD